MRSKIIGAKGRLQRGAKAKRPDTGLPTRGPTSGSGLDPTHYEPRGARIYFRTERTAPAGSNSTRTGACFSVSEKAAGSDPVRT